MPTLLHDFKYGLRVLLKTPGFTAAAVLVLALGIGANTAIFSVVNAVLLRPLPFQDPARLVQIWHVPPPKSFPGMTQFAVAAGNFLDWQSQNNVFERMALYTGAGFNLTGTDKPEALQASAVSADFFPVFGVHPLLGRVFAPDEDRPDHNHVVILGHALWQSHFGSDPHIVGRTISLDGQSYTVIGVMDAKFRRPGYAQMWTPLALTDAERAVRGEHHYSAIARLKPGIDIKQAQAEMSTISSRLEQQYPADNKGWGAVVVPLREELVGDVRPALRVLLGAVAFVLLIACANVANLVLAKTFARQKEIAIRTALGASRRRVLQQILTETVLLSLAAGALGLVFASFGVDLIIHFLGARLPRATEVGLDTGVLGFTLLISLLTGIISGLAPAWRLTKTNVNDALKQGLGRNASDSGGNRTRGALVVSEVALSLVLLVGAGLMIRTLWMLRSIDPGFSPQGVLTMRLAVSRARFPLPSQESAFANDLLVKVRALPGVESAGTIDDLPLQGGSNQPIAIEGQPVLPLSEQPEVAVRVISPGYVHAMRIPMLSGRDFTDADTADRTAAILISESLAKKFWPGQDAIGKRLTMGFFPDKVREVVGIVRDVKQDELSMKEPVATLYWPIAQLSTPAPSIGGWRSSPIVLVVRTSTEPSSLISAVTNAVHQVDKELPVTDVTTLEDFITESIAPQRFNMLLLATFAGLALLLAAVGIYSVLAYSVRRRVREIGIRMALGAQINDVLRLIVFEGMKPAILGVGIGLAGALALGRVLTTLVYGVSPTDPATFAAVSVLLMAVAFFASIIPAYRATKVEPMKTLRDE
jgi:putative ABC transport system permease protein